MSDVQNAEAPKSPEEPTAEAALAGAPASHFPDQQGVTANAQEIADAAAGAKEASAEPVAPPTEEEGEDEGEEEGEDEGQEDEETEE